MIHTALPRVSMRIICIPSKRKRNAENENTILVCHQIILTDCILDWAKIFEYHYTFIFSFQEEEEVRGVVLRGLFSTHSRNFQTLPDLFETL